MCSDIISLTADGIYETDLRIPLSSIKPDISVSRNIKQYNSSHCFWFQKVIFHKNVISVNI